MSVCGDFQLVAGLFSSVDLTWTVLFCPRWYGVFSGHDPSACPRHSISVLTRIFCTTSATAHLPRLPTADHGPGHADGQRRYLLAQQVPEMLPMRSRLHG
eukprot:scpid10670/ scgid2068/ 